MSIHIFTGKGKQFIVRARRPGHRKYELLGKASKSEFVAMRRLFDAMKKGVYRRGDILLCADYLEPLVIFEAVRK